MRGQPSLNELYAVAMLVLGVLALLAGLYSATGVNTSLVVEGLLMCMLLLSLLWISVRTQWPLTLVRFLRRAFDL